MGKETDVTINRERGIGGSDVPAIMGISPFTKRLELLQYKLGNRENEFEGNEYTEYGNEMEPKIRDHINKSLGYNFAPDYSECETDEELSLYYHSDGADPEKETLLEIKTTSQIHDSVSDYKVYLVQLMYGMWHHKWNKGILAVYERPEDFDTEFDASRLHIYQIGYDVPFMERILYAISQFRQDFHYLEEHPFAGEDELPSRSMLMEYANTMMRLEDSLAMAKQITTQYDEAKDKILEQMVKYGITSWTMPNGTKLTVVAKGEDKIVQEFDAKAFEGDHPKMYKEYLRDKTRKGKKAYLRVTYPRLAKTE